MKYPIKINVIFLKPVSEFLDNLPSAPKVKILENIKRVAGGEINNTIFKKLDDTQIWEFRTKFSGMEYRLLAFWDKNEKSLVVATHGFVKKTQKTPTKEIRKAERIKEDYYKQKN